MRCDHFRLIQMEPMQRSVVLHGNNDRVRGGGAVMAFYNERPMGGFGGWVGGWVGEGEERCRLDNE